MQSTTLTYMKAIAVTMVASVIAVLALAVGAPAYAEDASIFASGTGTQSDPYIISNASQLEAFRDDVNKAQTYESKYVALSADIDISGQQWTPIASAKRQSSGLASGSNSFAGTFDGAGHTISGLTMTPSGTQTLDADYALGLFGAVMGGTVKNLDLKDVNISCSLTKLAGGAVGILGENGTVSGVTVSGSVTGQAGIGGIVGRMIANGTIEDCVNDATVTADTGTGNVGGIVGAAYYTPQDSYMQIIGCTNNGAVSGTNDVGGIAGLCCAFVSGCINNGEITATSYATGGIAGEIKNYGGISHCENTATITNTSTSKPWGAGGIVGWVRYNGTAPDYAVSLPASIVDNTNSGEVKTDSAIGVGGIIGVLYSAGTVTGNENTAASLSGSQFISGIVGNLQDQGESTLPESVPEGALVENNVSTTPVADMTGDLTDPIAYNNDETKFTVQFNGTAWVASDESTGDLKYASLAHAVSNATDGDTVNLLADAEDVGMLEPQESDDITLMLNGHSIGFNETGGVTADGDTVTIEGDGNLYAEDGQGRIVPSASLFKTTVGSNGTNGKILLKGGTYPTDVSEYVAPGYEIMTLAEPNGFDNQYEVTVATSETPGTSTDDPSAGNAADGTHEVLPVDKYIHIATPYPIAYAQDVTRNTAGLESAGDDFGMWLIPVALVGAAAIASLCILAIRRRHSN